METIILNLEIDFLLCWKKYFFQKNVKYDQVLEFLAKNRGGYKEKKYFYYTTPTLTF